MKTIKGNKRSYSLILSFLRLKYNIKTKSKRISNQHAIFLQETSTQLTPKFMQAFELKGPELYKYLNLKFS